MTVRISENQTASALLNAIRDNRQTFEKYSNEVSTGIKVAEPGDSTYSGTVSQLRGVLDKIEGYGARVKNVESALNFQEAVLGQATDLLVRAKEVAAQGANETNSTTERRALAEEILEIRDHMVTLANSQYQGEYIFHGASTNTPPFVEDSYTTGEGGATSRWVYDDRSPEADGHDSVRQVRVTDNLTVRVNSPGNTTFENAVLALEGLARSLQGVRTDTPATAIGVPNTGNAYGDDEFSVQTADIKRYMDALDTARETEIQPERVNIAGRLKRLETASSLLDLTKISTKEVLSKLQDADMIDAASNLALAQTALEASLSVTNRVLNLSILNFL